jgi:hypothetical protein
LSHQVGQDATGCLTGIVPDVDALKEIAVAGISLNLGLGRGARESQRRLDGARPIRKTDQLPDLPETHQFLRAKVEHGDSMAKNAAAGVHGDVTARLRGGHGCQPLYGLRFVHLDAEAPRRLDDASNVG